jgi:hypothetical protein
MRMEAGKAYPFRVNSPLVSPNEKGITYSEDYRVQVMESPGIPPAIRSSLFQPLNKFRRHMSSYISELRNYGLRPDYPVVKLLGIQKRVRIMANRPLPTMSNYPQTSLSGGMGTSPRFIKALPSSKVVFNPPIYGNDNP